MEYKDTLNLPLTDFPMKANLNQREPEMLAKWEADGLYRQMEESGAAKPVYILHDGPPYANGHIHIGHALNKILKDMILKSKRMEGFHAPYVPGWDCHGLPIELQVEKNLGSKKQDMSKLEMRQECRNYAEKFIDIQKEEFKRLGVLGDWDNPYLTMNYEYEGLTAAELAKFAHNGGLYRGRKPVHWCSSCVTALAEAEVEYADHTSPSIFVKFRLKDDISAAIPALAGKEAYVVIWTTTPWTIPANLAIAMHPEFDYVALETEQGVLIVAEGLQGCLSQGTGLSGRCSPLSRPLPLSARTAGTPFTTATRSSSSASMSPWRPAPAASTPLPAMATTTIELALKDGLEIYNPVDNHGKYHPESRILRRTVRLCRQPERDRKADRSRRTGRFGAGFPLLPALLALQEADHLPRHRAVVHLHGSKRSPAEVAGSDQRGRVDSEMGAGADLRHDRKPSRLVHLPPAHLGGADHRLLLHCLR